MVLVVFIKAPAIPLKSKGRSAITVVELSSGRFREPFSGRSWAPVRLFGERLAPNIVVFELESSSRGRLGMEGDGLESPGYSWYAGRWKDG